MPLAMHQGQRQPHYGGGPPMMNPDANVFVPGMFAQRPQQPQVPAYQTQQNFTPSYINGGFPMPFQHVFSPAQGQHQMPTIAPIFHQLQQQIHPQLVQQGIPTQPLQQGQQIQQHRHMGPNQGQPPMQMQPMMASGIVNQPMVNQLQSQLQSQPFMQSNLYTQTQQVTPLPVQEKRQRKALLIVDPTTMKPVDLDNETKPSSEPIHMEEATAISSNSIPATVPKSSIDVEAPHRRFAEEFKPQVPYSKSPVTVPSTIENPAEEVKLSEKSQSTQIHSESQPEVVEHTPGSPQKPSRGSPEMDLEPISPTPLPETPSTNEDDFIEAKSRKKKGKKLELNERPSTGNDSESFKDALSTPSASSTAFASPASTPDVAPPPGMAIKPDENENHDEGVKIENTNSKESSPESDVQSENCSSTTEDIKDEEVTKSGSQIKLKYEKFYKEDQWSPINVEGKKQYDRDFLLQLQNDPQSLSKPANLPPMDIVKDKSQTMANNSQMGRDWMPEYIKASYSRGSMTKKPNNNRDPRDNKRGGNMPPPKIIDMKIEKVELHQTENAWRPSPLNVQTTSTEAEQDQTSIEVLTRKARGILNKLCPQKFDTLVKKFNELPIDTEDKLKLCMELIFEKAVDEPGFSVAYAQMCLNLSKTQVMSDAPNQSGSNFRKLLVTKCQKEFEKDYLDGLDKEKYEADLQAATTEEAKKELTVEWTEKERLARMRSLGNIRFIGELYKLKMLTGRIMHECVQRLLKSKDEESLECLCRLLTTVGKDLETETGEKLKKSSLDDCKKQGIYPLEAYFKEIQVIIEKKNTSSRVRFMLQDLTDLRKSNWKPRRDVAGPKTIEQIHKEAEREKTQNQLLNDMTPIRNRDRDNNMGGPGSQMRGGQNDSRRKPSRGQNQTDDGWQSVPAKAPQRPTFDKIDTNKISNLAQNSAKRMDADSLQLGPARNVWGQGSSSMRLSKTKEDPLPKISNKFDMLHDSDSGPASLGNLTSMQAPNDRFDNRQRNFGPSRSIGPTNRAMDQERRSAIEATARFGPKTNGPSSDVIEQSLKLKGKSDMTDDKFENELKLLIDEFINSGDEKDAIELICDRFHSSRMTRFTEEFLNKVLESCLTERKKVGTFLGHLILQNIIVKNQFEQALNTLLESASDLVVDIPKFWTYLGEILAPMFAINSIPLSFLYASGLDMDAGYPAKYLNGVLSTLEQHAGREKVAELYARSNLDLEKFMPTNKIPDFLESNKLDYLSSTKSSSSELTLDSFKKELYDKLVENPKNNDEIILWIEKNLGSKIREKAYIRVLVTAIAEYAMTKEKLADAFLERQNVLLRYLENDPERELQSLYALQQLMVKLEFPNQLLHQFFDALFNHEIINENSFYEWEKSDDPAEHDGRGVAIKSTTKFFTWLKEAENEVENED